MAFTTVASWRGAFGPLEYHGRTYGLRVHEFRRFFGLPGRASVPFEVALDIDEAEVKDLAQETAQATEKGDMDRVILGIVVMIVYVIGLNRLLWRPLFTLAERKYRMN
jgi:hypothetical protein